MLHKDIIQLSDRFCRLELHASYGGRETLRTLTGVLDDSKQTTIFGLIEELKENIRFLLSSLPPYAPPLSSINRFLLLLEKSLANGGGLEEIKSRMVALNEDTTNPRANHKKIANNLLEILPSDAVVYTHTLSETVLAVLLELHSIGKLNSVIVTESRPNNDGWDTARHLAENGLETHLTIDAAMPAAIENAHLMLSGAEIIHPDGSVVGKIGAYPAALLCEVYSKPLYIIADSSKINYLPWGDFFFNKITQEALGLDFSCPSLQITGAYFDITPSRLIRAYVTEKGVIDAIKIQSFISDKEVSSWLVRLVNDELSNSSLISVKEKEK